MASEVFRPQSIYWKGKKVAEINKSTFEWMNNNANQYGTEGVLGQSRGAQECRVEMTTVTPVLGHEEDFANTLVSEETVTVGIFVDNTLKLSDGTLTGMTYDGDSKTGEQTCKITFIGGKPEVAV